MKRLDLAVYDSGFAESRTAAQNLILNQNIELDGKIVTKPSEKVKENSQIKLVGEIPKFVGRGGYKLETALEKFNISLINSICLDIGASTGGFTDCMLQNGAKKVYAVDVGTNQLNQKLKNDLRVVSMENTDIRNAVLPELVDFISVDVSFISVKLIIPFINRLLNKDGEVCLLLKPQFEVGKIRLKNGILKDEKIKNRIVDDIEKYIDTLNYTRKGTVKSKIKGSGGNEEFLIYFTQSEKRDGV